MKKFLILLVAICCCGCNDTGTNTSEPSEKLNVAQYFKDMRDVAIEMSRILTSDGHVCIVIGNTKIKDVNIKSASFINGAEKEILTHFQTAQMTKYRLRCLLF